MVNRKNLQFTSHNNNNNTSRLWYLMSVEKLARLFALIALFLDSNGHPQHRCQHTATTSLFILYKAQQSGAEHSRTHTCPPTRIHTRTPRQFNNILSFCSAPTPLLLPSLLLNKQIKLRERTQALQSVVASHYTINDPELEWKEKTPTLTTKPTTIIAEEKHEIMRVSFIKFWGKKLQMKSNKT